MARKCTCCAHVDAGGIDAALIDGTSFRDVSTRYALSKPAVARHAAEHLPNRIAASRALLAAVDRRDGAQRLATMTRAEFLLQALERLEQAHTAAVAAGDVRGRIAAVDAQLRALHRVGLLGPDDAEAGIVTRPVPKSKAEDEAERLKAMTSNFLSLTNTLRAQLGMPVGSNVDHCSDTG